MMVQPKTPPLSIRPGEERLALIEAHAKRRGITRHAAVLELIDLGLAPKPQAALTKPAVKIAAPKAEPKPAPFKSRLKGQWKAP